VKNHKNVVGQGRACINKDTTAVKHFMQNLGRVLWTANLEDWAWRTALLVFPLSIQSHHTTQHP